MTASADALTMAARYSADGNLAAAQQLAASVLTAQPGHPEALNMLGVIAWQTNDAALAIEYFQRSLASNAANVIVWKNLADVHLATANCRAAAANYEQALRLSPELAEAHHNLGIAWQHLHEREKAVAALREAVRLAPTNVAFLANLSRVLREQERWAEASVVYQAAQTIEPDSPELATNLGITLHEQGRLDDAVAAYRQALRLKPDFAAAKSNLATALKEQGDLDEAIVHYREVVKLQPYQAAAYFNLSDLAAAGLFEFAPEELSRVQVMLASERHSAFDRSLCGLVLARVMERQGRYDEAFGYYQEANNLRRRFLQERNMAFDARAHQALIERIMAHYDEAYFQRVAGWGTDSELPVFIIGMPRSGSTLVEQILASHPRVCGTGELGEVIELLGRLGSAQHAEVRGRAGAPFDRCPLTADFFPVVPDQRAASDLAVAYLRYLDQLGWGAARVINKTLENHLHLGVIVTLFPRARIIHCRRDPLDICTSCFFQNFHKLTFAWALEDIGAYYRAYEKLMNHWDRVLPVRIHEVFYERLIEDQEDVTRGLVAACGLEWDERCLSFWDTRRVVRTASTVQVRKPISAGSIGRWRHYHSRLGPLLKALGR
jgi:tetratricopeptide (TPR) repeat protein